ncbi:MAG TPA: aminodeoxychorismate/anthranilate synthase component II [Planctomycetota bacterium]|nr:aminodeoxychorismate/anthranilate synthase component II [Planctomycetota bacterium]
MILVIDNYDSFTYNLVQTLGGLGADLKVVRNDKITIADIKALKPEKIIISPGPCTPNEAGVSVATIREFAGKLPLLGVCLGHQSIGAAFGATVARADRLMHGKTSKITHDGKGLYEGLSNPFEATRYHSLIVKEETLPPFLKVVSRTQDMNEVMGIRHVEWPLEGVQFHPESFLTTEGTQLLKNFLTGHFFAAKV